MKRILLFSLLALWSLSAANAVTAQTHTNSNGNGPGDAVSPAPPFIIELDPLLQNLSDIAPQYYVKLTIEIGAETEELADEVKSRLPQIRDAILMLLVVPEKHLSY